VHISRHARDTRVPKMLLSQPPKTPKIIKNHQNLESPPNCTRVHKMSKKIGTRVHKNFHTLPLRHTQTAAKGGILLSNTALARAHFLARV
jgi:hypothetical protein